ncbi:receptor-like protein EIX2 [Senna tora]|uniref:Receptor-like protein EIX2 n=1 Tax=Senna tora TaxID=362788 RepID=A0A834TLQ7_9FABA|nr:receptor-like protein EIX2 [Senna tora]
MIIASSIRSSNGHQLVYCLASDREALLDFKSGLKDPDNVLSSWSGTNCCEWYGIRCNNNTGAVVSIDLHNPYNYWFHPSTSRDGFRNLSGEIRPSLMKLKSIRHLDLSFNTFNGISIPAFFGSLENLKYLNLSNAGFNGIIPSNLGNLSHLKVLDLEYMYNLDEENLEWLSGLISLQHLIMSGIDLSRATDWVGKVNKLPFITELNLRGCGLHDYNPSLTSLNFTSLTVIDLSHNYGLKMIPDWLLNISSLQYIDMRDCGLHGRIPLGLGELPNLVSLDLHANDLTANCSQLFIGGRWKKIQMLDLSNNKLHSKLPSYLGNMTSLTHLDLLFNAMEGGIPSSIGKLCNLNYLNLAENKMAGSLPEFLEGIETCPSRNPLPNLKILVLHDNQLVGKIPYWLGQLENLEELDLSNNHFASIISESHFSKLTNLKSLDLSSNSLTVNVSSNWIPPFQLQDLYMGSCVLGPSFPAWLKSQKQLINLDFSNASISDSIPNWFWDIFPDLYWLNFSHNQLQGQLPNPLQMSQMNYLDLSFNLLEGPINIENASYNMLDLSHNHFSGHIPQNLSERCSFLSLSNNNLSGKIPMSMGRMFDIEVLDLSSNKFIGRIPSSLANCSWLNALDLRSNSLSGTIASLGQLQYLRTLHLSDNQLSGKLPSSFINLTNLETMDLGSNQFSGDIPAWIGDGFSCLRILILRSNSFTGEIHSELSKLSSLQILDLGDNCLSGNIPPSLGDLRAMAQEQRTNKFLQYGYRETWVGGGGYYKESLIVNMKGMSLEYTKTLSLVTSIDLSGNKLSGKFPQELMKLSGLVVLNLSRNHITGNIPKSISNMHQLSSLDLSSNHLSGSIPPSLSSLSFLGYLNLSNNNLSGVIPYTGHMTTFEAPSYAENPGLCGLPLPLKCPSDDDDPNKGASNEETDGDDDDGFIDKWFYLSLGLGFAVGLLVPYIILAVKRSWSDVYFDFVDLIIYRLSIKIHKRRINRGRKSNKLSSLDLSSNQLSGSIPPSLSSLSFLGHLNLSDNNLSGVIPYTGHMTTFEAPSYAGNPGRPEPDFGLILLNIMLSFMEIMILV